MDNKKVLIAGGSGFIGQKLTSLLIDRGYDVSTLTRKPKHSKDIFWNPVTREINLSQLSEIDVLVNLVGENIGLGRWTKKRKKELVDSRVDSTTFLCEIAEKMPKLSYFISASAINCYGKESDKIHIESDDFGSNFSSISREYYRIQYSLYFCIRNGCKRSDCPLCKRIQNPG